MSAALHLRALEALPAPLAAMCRMHPFQQEADDLVGEAAVAWLLDPEAPAEVIFSRARARARRFAQDAAHFGRGLDAAADLAAPAEDEDQTPMRRRDVVRDIAIERRVTSRRARQIVAAQIARAQQGDLFHLFQN